MKEVLQDRQTVDFEPQLTRRGMLGAGVLAASQILRGDYGSLLAQEKQTSANDLLGKLPEKIVLAGGGEATVEKVEVPNARYLLTAIRTVHSTNDPKDMTPEIKKVVDGCSGEIDQIIMQLYRKNGITTFAPEGYTHDKILSHYKTLQRLDTVPQTIATLQKLNRFKEAAQLEQALRELDEELRSNIPYPSVLPLLKSNKLQIFAAETDEAIRKSQEADENRLLNRHSGSWIREDASLELLHIQMSSLKIGPGVISPWGASHWQPFGGRPAKEKQLPARVEMWNKKNGKAKFSTAIITPPTVKEYVRTHPFPPPPDR